MHSYDYTHSVLLLTAILPCHNILYLQEHLLTACKEGKASEAIALIQSGANIHFRSKRQVNHTVCVPINADTMKAGQVSCS